MFVILPAVCRPFYCEGTKWRRDGRRQESQHTILCTITRLLGPAGNTGVRASVTQYDWSGSGETVVCNNALPGPPSCSIGNWSALQRDGD